MNTIELVREAGIYDGREGLMWCSKEQLERFATLVRAEALGEAAKRCDEYAALEEMGSNEQCVVEDCAAAIRGLK